MRYDLTLTQVHALKVALGDQFEDDERGWLDAIEGETDAFEFIGKLLDRIERDEGDRAILTAQMDDRKIRRDRIDKRISAQREGVIAIMACAGVDKLTLPEATLSVRDLAAKLVVNDPSAVPEEYSVQSWKPSMDKIKAAFSPDNDNLPNWLRVEDARPSLTVRRK